MAESLPPVSFVVSTVAVNVSNMNKNAFFSVFGVQLPSNSFLCTNTFTWQKLHEAERKRQNDTMSLSLRPHSPFARRFSLHFNKNSLRIFLCILFIDFMIRHDIIFCVSVNLRARAFVFVLATEYCNENDWSLCSALSLYYYYYFVIISHVTFLSWLVTSVQNRQATEMHAKTIDCILVFTTSKTAIVFACVSASEIKSTNKRKNERTKEKAINTQHDDASEEVHCKNSERNNKSIVPALAYSATQTECMQRNYFKRKRTSFWA